MTPNGEQRSFLLQEQDKASSASAMPSSSSSSSSSSLLVAVRPLEGTNASSSSSSSFRPSPPLRPRGRRPLRILYPPSLSRRPAPLREAPDAARRWLLLLSALLFLQIYTEEPHCCTELQSHGPDVAAAPPQEGEGSLGSARGWAGEEPWRVQTVGGASGTQLECVVA